MLGNVRQKRRGNQKWIIQRQRQHWTRDEDKKNKNKKNTTQKMYLVLLHLSPVTFQCKHKQVNC